MNRWPRCVTAMSKQRREDAKRCKTEERKREHSARMSVRLVKPDIHSEVRFIRECARAGDSRTVTLGHLVLFSTRTRDAWLLDPDDGLALCLCRAGELQPFRIDETAASFVIEWTANFAIQPVLPRLMPRINP